MPVGVTTWQIVFLLLLTAIGLSIISGFLGNEEEWIVLFKHINGFPFVLLSISIIFAAPISEEIMFRGFLLNASMWYGPNGKWIGILASSLIFSSLHTQYTLL
ncbi:CPBP family intramembrane glutamic endopeptidase [Providencia manganoxydans]|uniref:CPBP family intramembrane glutamic endopeptidase n=1 Tax=Providencia manganoxydans TaxID=2923283 RepID=UPI0032DB8901